MLALNTIHHGCCLELMKSIPDGSVDMVLCDLPYGTTSCHWDSVIPFDKLWAQYERIIKPNGAIVLTASQPFTSALVMSNPKLFRYEWIWEKSRATLFQHANKMPMKRHESVLVFYKKLPSYTPQFTAGKPYTDKRTERRGMDGLMVGHAETIKTPVENDGRRFPTSVLPIPHNNEPNLHPTQKPVALFEYLIKTYTNPGEVVLDNCAGSATTAIAALNTGRQFICIEQEEKYVAIGRKRIQDRQPTLELA